MASGSACRGMCGWEVSRLQARRGTGHTHTTTITTNHTHTHIHTHIHTHTHHHHHHLQGVLSERLIVSAHVHHNGQHARGGEACSSGRQEEGS